MEGRNRAGGQENKGAVKMRNACLTLVDFPAWQNATEIAMCGNARLREAFNSAYVYYRSITSSLVRSLLKQDLPAMSNLSRNHISHLGKSRRSMSSKDVLGGTFRDTVRKREFEVLGKELFEIGALDIIGLFELNDFEDLCLCRS